MGTLLPEGSGARGFLQVHELTADCSVLNEAGHDSLLRKSWMKLRTEFRSGNLAHFIVLH